MALGSLILALTPALSLAEPLSDPLCGTTIVQNLVLDRDVVCYNSGGIVVGAEGVTIDLNGKTIVCSNGAGPSCPGSRFIGIDASNVSSVAIKGPGNVTGFGTQLVAATNFLQAAGVNSRARQVRTRQSARVRPPGGRPGTSSAPRQE